MARDQRVGILLLATIVVFSPLIEGGTTHFAAMILRLLVLSLLAVHWMTTVYKDRFRWPHLNIDLPVVGYLVLALCWTLFSPYVNQSIQWLIVLVSYAVVLYLAVWVLDRRSRIEQIVVLLIILGLGESFLAGYQHTGLGTSRSTGTFFNPNFLAGYLAAVSMIVFAKLCHLNLRWEGVVVRRLRQFFPVAGLVTIMAVLIGGIMLTGSRGGMVALLVGVGVVASMRMGWRGMVAVSLCAVMVVVVPNRVRDRIFYEYRTNPESYARIQMWKAALTEIGDYPFGIGLGLYQYSYPRYAFPIEERVFRYGKTAQTPHSEYLQMAIELSVASVVCFGLGVLVVFLTVRQMLRRRIRRQMRGLVVGCAGGTTVILTQAVVDSNLHEPGITILLVLFVAIIFALQRLLQPQAKKDFAVRLHGRGVWGTMGILLIFVLAWQVVRLGAAYAVYESAVEFMRRNAVESAIERYQQAVALDAGKALYHSALAGAYLSMFERRGSEEVAQRMIEEFQAARDLNPLDGRQLGLLAGAYARLAEHLKVETTAASIQSRQWIMKAIELSERASELEPVAFAHLFQRAHYYLQLGQTIAAQMMIQRALEIEPNFLPARELLIHLYLRSGTMEAAKREYGQIVLRRSRYAISASDVREQQFLQVSMDKVMSEFERAGVPIP